jgi:arginase family enzyme
MLRRRETEHVETREGFERVVSCGSEQRWRTKLDFCGRKPFDDHHRSTTLGQRQRPIEPAAISLATISALQTMTPLSVLWLDAHNDTGEVKLDCSVDHGNVARFVVQLPNVMRILQLGTRGYRVETTTDLPDEKLRIVSVEDMRRFGLRPFRTEFSNGLPWYISLDVDVLDPSVAPATSTPMPGGLTLDEIRGILETLAESAQIAGMDVVGLNPRLDVGNTCFSSS